MRISILITILSIFVFIAPAFAGRSLLWLPPDPDLVDGIIRVEIQGIASQTFFVKMNGDSLYLPFLQLCDFLRIYTTATDDLAEVAGEVPAGRPFRIARTEGVAWHDGDSIRFDPQWYHPNDGEIYIEQSFIARWLDIPMKFDPFRLWLSIGADDRLPRVQLARDRKRYASLRMEQSGRSYISAGIDRKIFGHPMVDWSLSGSHRPASDFIHGGLRLGAPFLYGVLNLNSTGIYSSVDSAARSFTIGSWSWQYFLPDFNLLRKIEAGSNSYGAGREYYLEMSNYSLSPRFQHVTEDLTGTTRPGWMVEMHEGNRLVDVTRADSIGHYRFRTPLGYGTSDRTIVQVGPHGERIAEQRRFELSPRILPPGEVEYRARFAGRRYPLGNPVEGSIAAGFGVTNRLTLGADALVEASSMGTLSFDSLYPALSATYWLGESGLIGVRYNPRRGVFKGEFSWLTMENAIYRLGFDSVALDGHSLVSSASFSIPWGRFMIGGTGRYAELGGTRLIHAAPRFAAYFGSVSLDVTTALRWSAYTIGGGGEEPFTPLNNVGVTTTLHLISSAIPSTLLSARGAYDHRTGQLSSLGLSARYYLSRSLGLGLFYSVTGSQWRSPSLRLQVKLDINRALGIVLAEEYQQEELTTSVYMSGAATMSHEGIHFSRQPSVGQSTIVVRAFHDENGNGRRDNDEEDLGPVRAQLLEGSLQMTSSTGMFTAVPANRECMIQIDRWMFIDHGLFPRRTRFGLYSVPSSLHQIDVPCAAGFDVEGRCTITAPATGRAARISSLLGLAVELVSIDGTATYEGEIFHDGTLLITGVAAGEYYLKFDEKQLESRRLRVGSTVERVVLSDTATKLPGVVLEAD